MKTVYISHWANKDIFIRENIFNLDEIRFTIISNLIDYSFYYKNKNDKGLNNLITFFLPFINNINDLKIVLCAMSKRKFIFRRIPLRIIDIFIYDNNEPNNEKIYDVNDKSYKNKITIVQSPIRNKTCDNVGNK